MCTLFHISLDTGLCLLCHFPLWFERKQRTLVARMIQIIYKLAPCWHRGDITVLIVEKSCYVCFISLLKVSSTLHKIHIEPLMEYSGDAFHTFSGPWQCNLFVSQCDSHKPPCFHPKYLKLFSKTNKAFTGLEPHGRKWKTKTKIITFLGWNIPLSEPIRSGWLVSINRLKIDSPILLSPRSLLCLSRKIAVNRYILYLAIYFNQIYHDHLFIPDGFTPLQSNLQILGVLFKWIIKINSLKTTMQIMHHYYTAWPHEGW